MSEIRRVAIEKLSEMNMPATDKVTLARECHVATWLQEGIITLSNDVHTLKIEEVAAVLGWETTARIFAIRDSALRTALPSEDGQYSKTSRLTCIGCSSSPSSPGGPYPTCCSGSSGYGSYRFQGYTLKPDSGDSFTVSPLAKHAAAINSSALDLFGEELKALDKY
ncbi:hypothetical protein BKA70DRAFT_272375 [Coprinopsis sp. MPI-PUGE-AT-0042]|nr:hypothetical protein BKA70DRAFT_272375 [Coprinopsis sp. MPI-PUGE-AT-0042]